MELSSLGLHYFWTLLLGVVWGSNAWKFFRIEQDKLFEITKDEYPKATFFIAEILVPLSNKNLITN